MSVEFYEDRSGKYRWRITAGTNEIIGGSTQGFSTKQKAEENLDLLMCRCSKGCCKNQCDILHCRKSSKTD